MMNVDVSKQVRMGVGDAIKRLIHVEHLYRNGTHELPGNALAERDMLIHALNHLQLDIGFDCNGDGVPDTVEIFQQAVETSCCRIVRSDEPTGRVETSSGRIEREPTSRRG